LFRYDCKFLNQPLKRWRELQLKQTRLRLFLLAGDFCNIRWYYLFFSLNAFSSRTRDQVVAVLSTAVLNNSSLGCTHARDHYLWMRVGIVNAICQFFLYIEKKKKKKKSSSLVIAHMMATRDLHDH
jgi:hypothetical protein